MKWLLATLFVLTHALTPKLCIRCKYFIANRKVGIEFGKCNAFPKVTFIDTNYLVTGKTIYKEDYWYCSTARQHDNLCGTNGTRFEKMDRLN